MPDICRAERDALVGCAAPRVLTCIEGCRELDAADPVLVPEGVDAESCPKSPLPCERLCWAIDGAVNANAGSAPNAAEDDPTDLPALGAADLNTLGAALVGCARERARSCWDQALAGEPPAEAVSWTGSFLECAAPFIALQPFAE